jgi:hypothetical protein
MTVNVLNGGHLDLTDCNNSEQAKAKLDEIGAFGDAPEHIRAEIIDVLCRELFPDEYVGKPMASGRAKVMRLDTQEEGTEEPAFIDSQGNRKTQAEAEAYAKGYKGLHSPTTLLTLLGDLLHDVGTSLLATARAMDEKATSITGTTNPDTGKVVTREDAEAGMTHAVTSFVVEKVDPEVKNALRIAMMGLLPMMMQASAHLEKDRPQETSAPANATKH